MNFQPFHHDMSILRGCHYSIKKRNNGISFAPSRMGG